MRPTLLVLALLGIAACGPGGLQPGGARSGMPDTTVGDWRQPLGAMRNDGTIELNRERPSITR